jgi:hypothetical protein
MGSQGPSKHMDGKADEGEGGGTGEGAEWVSWYLR